MTEMNYDWEMVNGIARRVLSYFDGVRPTIAITLGSGLGKLGENTSGVKEIRYEEVGLPPCAIAGHTGVMRLMHVGQNAVLLFSGRHHMYEGYTPQEVVLLTSVAATLGAWMHIITCASGGINPAYKPGDLVILSDHLNLTSKSPLTGTNDDRAGVRFPDMTNVYDTDLRAIAKKVGRERLGMDLREGVYAMLPGPSYETPAEVRMLGILGADMAGMSTALEAIKSRHMGMRVLGISCVTNLAAGISKTPLSHDEVEETAAKTRSNFGQLILGIAAEVSFPPR